MFVGEGIWGGGIGRGHGARGLRGVAVVVRARWRGEREDKKLRKQKRGGTERDFQKQ